MAADRGWEVTAVLSDKIEGNLSGASQNGRYIEVTAVRR